MMAVLVCWGRKERADEFRGLAWDEGDRGSPECLDGEDEELDEEEEELDLLSRLVEGMIGSSGWGGVRVFVVVVAEGG